MVTKDSNEAEWSVIRLVIAGVGLAVATAGVLILRWASPSPHGYIEIFFGLPVLSLGLALTGLGVVLQGRPFSLPMRVLGWVLLSLALPWFVAIMWFTRQ